MGLIFVPERPTTPPGEAALSDEVVEPHYTPKQIAEKLGFSEMTIIRMFQDMPGVFKLNHGLGGKKRKNVHIRIPRSVLKAYLARMSK